MKNSRIVLNLLKFIFELIATIEEKREQEHGAGWPPYIPKE